jgi:hypothetical protein
MWSFSDWKWFNSKCLREKLEQAENLPELVPSSHQAGLLILVADGERDSAVGPLLDVGDVHIQTAAE